ARPLGRHHDLSRHSQRTRLRRRQPYRPARAQVHGASCRGGAEERGVLVQSHQSTPVGAAEARQAMTDTDGAPAIRGIRRRVVCLLLMGIVAPNASSVPAQTPGAATTTLYTQEDLLFLSHMIVHHRHDLGLAG